MSAAPAEPAATPGRARTRRGRALGVLCLLGLVLMPPVCVAHATVTLWVYRGTGDTARLLLLLPFLLSLALLGCAALLLWLAADGDHGHDAAALLALGGLMFAYLFTYMGAGDWMLRWQGSETTCTVRGVDTRRDWVPAPTDATDTGSHEVTRYDHRMDCAAADAPGEMTVETGERAVGERIAVVYDASPAWGSWGAAPAEELQPGNDTMGVSAAVVTAGTGMWTLSVLGCALARARTRLRART